MAKKTSLQLKIEELENEALTKRRELESLEMVIRKLKGPESVKVDYEEKV